MDKSVPSKSITLHGTRCLLEMSRCDPGATCVDVFCILRPFLRLKNLNILNVSEASNVSTGVTNLSTTIKGTKSHILTAYFSIQNYIIALSTKTLQTTPIYGKQQTVTRKRVSLPMRTGLRIS